MKSCSFATTCWENDWEHILCTPEYLSLFQIERNCYPFAERILIINNVSDLENVKKRAETLISEGVLTRYVVAQEIAQEMLLFFGLSKEDFALKEEGQKFNLHPDWLYYNALGPLAAIYENKSDYLLYMTGDVWLKQPVCWIEKAIKIMEKKPLVKVANLLWNGAKNEAKKEAYKKSWNFFFSKDGFSDQMFLVAKDVARSQMYGELRGDLAHFPRGETFERRFFSYMKNRDWERITFRRGSYTHENIIK
jgi:hypothetical protein